MTAVAETDELPLAIILVMEAIVFSGLPLLAPADCASESASSSC